MNRIILVESTLQTVSKKLEVGGCLEPSALIIFLTMCSNGRGTRGRGSWLGGRPLIKATTWNQMQAYQV